jgi:DNA polymerase-1
MSQVAALPELLDALGLTIVEAPDEPHVVASYTRAALGRGDDVVIVGTDKRFAQLVSDDVWWYDANKAARYTPDIVKKRFGVGPERVGDWLALVGDDDQVPGINGIGAKGATTLLDAFPSVEAALASSTLEGRLRKALESAGAALAQHLAGARLSDRPLPTPLDACVFNRPDAARLNPHLDALGFVELLLATDVATNVVLCTSPDDFQITLRSLSGVPGLYALIDDDDPRCETIRGIAVADGQGSTCWVDVESAAWPALVEWLQDAGADKGGHDLVGTIATLQRAGVAVAGLVYDSACASHLSEPSNWAPHDLPIVARHVLGRSLAEDDQIRGNGTTRKAWGKLDDAVKARVASDRADASAAVWRSLNARIDRSLMAEYLELSDTLVRMELHGITIDVAQLDRAETAFAALERDLEAQIGQLAGHQFNINSSAQLGQVLFEELGLPVVSRTKTGYSTSIEALERIENAHPLVGLVLRWRLLRRLRDNWLRSLRRNIHDDGRVHSRFYPARSFSGQIVSTQPDLSRVPGRTPEMAEIRRAFVAAPGRSLMAVDFVQLGLHVLAHLTRDPALTEPLRQRADMHRLTAAAILDKPPEDVTFEERQIGKVVNFATFAGQGPSALALQLGITASQAKDYIARFDRRYAGVRAFQDEQLRLAAERGFLVTMAGRRWPIAGLSSLDSELRSYAERLARRGTHEASVADVARRALLEADRTLQREGLSGSPIVEVVDEVLFEVDDRDLPRAATACAHAMRHAFELEVPLTVGVEVGKNWADMEPYAGD